MNTYNPKLTLMQMAQHLRYAKLERQLRPLCMWVDFYDYIWSYGSIDWKDKVVLDIGAEVGSSALFFLMNGAKRMRGMSYRDLLAFNLPSLVLQMLQMYMHEHHSMYESKRLP